jgi:hypothetical protein
MFVNVCVFVCVEQHATAEVVLAGCVLLASVCLVAGVLGL